MSGRPGEPPAHAGTDFIISQDGPDCRRLSLFSTGYPELDSAVLRHTDKERFVGNPYLGIISGLPVIRPRLRLFHCQHGQGSVIQKLPPAELGYVVQQC